MNSFSVNSTFSKAQGKMCLLALVEKTCSKKLVKNAWNWRFCAFSTSSVKNVVESKAYLRTWYFWKFSGGMFIKTGYEFYFW